MTLYSYVVYVKFIKMSELDYIKQYFSIQFNEILCWWWYYINEISWQLLIAVVAYLCVCVFLYMILRRVSHVAWHLPGPPSRILLVTAHPDDEVMFFGPLIYWTTRSEASNIYLLCLSMGGDKRRKEELWDCTKKLGIPEANVTIIISINACIGAQSYLMIKLYSGRRT